MAFNSALCLFIAFDPEQSKSASQSHCVCYAIWSPQQELHPSPFAEMLSCFSEHSQIQATFCLRKKFHDLSHLSLAQDFCCNR